MSTHNIGFGKPVRTYGFVGSLLSHIVSYGHSITIILAKAKV